MSFLSGLLRFRSPAGLPCQQLVEMVTDYLEGAFEPEQCQLFEEHLADCPPCTRYVETIFALAAMQKWIADAQQAS